MITHPRQNRVTPFGEIEATSAKGLFLGNRGDIHAPDGTLSRRRSAVKAWICCTLTPKRGGRIEFDRKGTYYPLFFLDEATAFSAGHRPCAQCRYQDYQRFKHFWNQANGLDHRHFVPAAEIDGVLHGAREGANHVKKTFEARLGDLPDGAIVSFAEAPSTARLLLRGRAWRWNRTGYDDAMVARPDMHVTVLTPAPFIGVFKAGYAPLIHPSALILIFPYIDIPQVLQCRRALTNLTIALASC
jgi:hypothetical protein